jgi:hypothetical protein
VLERRPDVAERVVDEVRERVDGRIGRVSRDDQPRAAVRLEVARDRACEALHPLVERGDGDGEAESPASARAKPSTSDGRSARRSSAIAPVTPTELSIEYRRFIELAPARPGRAAAKSRA